MFLPGLGIAHKGQLLFVIYERTSTKAPNSSDLIEEPSVSPGGEIS